VNNTLLDRDINNISYADYVRDPLDFSKVNAELVKDQYRNVVLKAIKNINVGKEYLLHSVRISGLIY